MAVLPAAVLLPPLVEMYAIYEDIARRMVVFLDIGSYQDFSSCSTCTRGGVFLLHEDRHQPIPAEMMLEDSNLLISFRNRGKEKDWMAPEDPSEIADSVAEISRYKEKMRRVSGPIVRPGGRP